MVSILDRSSSFLTNKPNRFLPTIHLNRPVNLSVKSQQESSTEETTSENAGNPSTGQGFGSSASSSAAAPAKKKPVKGKRQRSSIIRREPVEKPSFAMPEQDGGKAEEMGKNESAFLLAWLGLGAVILVEGLALAASGFLPEAWDGFFVKYLYPSFTPTVVLFICGTVGYGVLKYLQNDNSSKEN